MTTSEAEIALTQKPVHGPMAELAKWELHKQHRLCRSFNFSSRDQAFRFVADLCGLTVQHQQRASLRVRDELVFFEVEVAEGEISDVQLRFIKSIGKLEQAAT